MPENEAPMSEQMAIARRHAHVEDVRWLRNWAEHNPKACVVQLGAGSGTMAVALWEGSRDLRMWTVDNELAMLHWERAALENMGAEVSDGPSESAFCRHIVGDSVSVWNSPGLRDEEIGLLILDTTHDYVGTKKELSALLPIFDHKTVIMLHDYDPIEKAPVIYEGVEQAADEVAPLLGWSVTQRVGWSGILTFGVPKKKPGPKPKPKVKPLREYTVKELRAICKEKGVAFKTVSKKPRLLELLAEAGVK